MGVLGLKNGSQKYSNSSGISVIHMFFLVSLLLYYGNTACFLLQLGSESFKGPPQLCLGRRKSDMRWYHLCSSCKEQEVSSVPKVRVASSLQRNITGCNCSQRDLTFAENQLYEVLLLKHFSPCQPYFCCKVGDYFPPEAIMKQLLNNVAKPST